MPRNNLKNRSVPRQARPHLHASMHVLASAAVLVLTSAPALADPAATLDYRTARIGGTDAWLTQYTVPYSSSYVDWIVAQQDQRGNLSSLAQASGGASGIFAATIGVASGVSGGTPTTLVDSVIRATTVGNQKPATLDLALLANSGLKEGLGISVGQVMGGGVSGGAPLAVSATARAVDNQVAITQQYLPAATLVLDGSSISASTTLNTATSRIEGTIDPAGFSSATSRTGAIDLIALSDATNGSGGSVVDLKNTATGSATIGTFQTAQNAGMRAGSSATVSGGSVLVDVSESRTLNSASTSTTLTAPVTLSDNAVAATYAGNTATSVFNAAAGSGAFQGSVAVSSAQVATESSSLTYSGGAGAAAMSTASVTGTTVSANLLQRDQTGAGIATLANALTVSGNSLAATSTGNAAGSLSSTGAVQVGNAIVLDGLSSLAGTGSATRNFTGVSGDSGGSVADVSLGADLVLANAQLNVNTALVSRATSTAVEAYVDTVNATGSVTLTGNAVTAAATGNLGGNLIQTSATNTSTTAALANAQGNYRPAGTTGDGVQALASDVQIGSFIGVSGGADVAVAGTVTLSGNAVDLTARGNLASSTIAMSAANDLTAQASGGAAGGVTIANVATEATDAVRLAGGVTASNLQGNYGTTNVIASGGSIAIKADFIEQSSEGVQGATGNSAELNGATASLSGNAIRSTAAGNTATTTVALSATNADTQAALANSQVNAAGLVQGTLNASGVTTTAGKTTGSTLTLADNTVATQVTGNDATNRLSGTFGTLAAGPNAASSTTASLGGTASGTTTQANAAFSVGSVQVNEAGLNANNLVSASGTATPNTGSAFALIDAGQQYGGTPGTGGIGSSTLTASGNSASASATANRGANSLALDVGQLNASGGSAVQVGSLASLQVASGTGTSLTAIGRSGGTATDVGPIVGIRFQDAVTDVSTLTVSGNAVQATGQGNDVTNRVSATGTTLGATAASPGALALTAAATGTVGNEFALANAQVDAFGGSGQVGNSGTAGRVVIADGVVTGIGSSLVSGGSAIVTSSTLNVAGNRVGAEGRANTAANTVALTGFTELASGAGLLNTQSTSTTLDVSVAQGFTGIATPTATDATGTGESVTDSTLTVGSNQTRVLGLGNVAQNAMTVQATTLSGNAALTAGTGTAGVQGAGVSGGITASFGVGNFQVSSGSLTGALREAAVGVDLGAASVSGGSIAVVDNLQSAVVQANSGTSSLGLSASQASNLSGAVVSTQDASGAVTAAQTAGTPYALGGTGASAVAAGVKAGSLQATPTVVSGNAVTVAAGMNEAFNTASASGISVGGAQAGGFGSTVGMSGAPSSSADLAIVSQQTASADVTARALMNTTNTSGGGTIGLVASGTLTGSTVTVDGNAVSASASDNLSASTLSLQADSALSARGSVTNSQSIFGGVKSAQVGGSDGSLLGASFADAASTSPTTVSSNAATAEARGNQATNTLIASAGEIRSTLGTGTIGTLSATTTENASQEFAIVSRQNDEAGGRTATVANVSTGVTWSSSAGDPTSVTSSNLTVTGNTTAAEARNNDATNRLALAGVSSASSSAGVLNDQNSSSAATARVTGGWTGVQSVGTTPTLTDSNLSVTGNTTRGIAVGSSAVNSLQASATTLGSNANFAATSGGGTIALSNNATTVNSGFGLANRQVQSGAVMSTVETTQGVALDAVDSSTPGSFVGASGGGIALTVSGNSSSAVAQSTSAANTLTLSGTSVSAVSGAVASVQDSSAPVTATFNALPVTLQTGLAFGVRAGDVQTSALGGAALTVSGNNGLASAGQNEAFNTLNVSGTSVTGAAKGSNASGYSYPDASGGAVITSLSLEIDSTSTDLQAYGGAASGGTASAGTDYSVLNAQKAGGNVSASAATTGGAFVGAALVSAGTDAALTPGAKSTTLTVSDNTLNAKANANYASNALNLSASGSLGASGSVSNVQFGGTAGESVSATIGGASSQVSVGIAPPVPADGTVLNNAVATVTGNALNAQAGGNTASNALNASAVSGVGSASAYPTFGMLNYQGNAYAVTATVAYANVGVNAGGSPASFTTPGQLNGALASVTGNTASAMAYGNTASNALTLAALPGGQNQGAGGITSVQTNTGNVSAQATNVAMGVSGNTGTAAGNQVVVSGNSISAQAVGNAAVSAILGRKP